MDVKKLLVGGMLLACSLAYPVSASSLVHTTHTLSQPRYYLSATTVGNKAFFAGGAHASGYSNVVDIYDTDTGLWSTDTLSQGRYYLSATSVGNKAIFAGGFTGPPGAIPSNVVDIYDADTGLWATHTLSQARGVMAATTVGSKALFAGGTGLSDVVDIYDADTGLWSAETLSQARCYIAATTVGNKAIFAGGSADSDVVDIYDVDTGLWSTDTLSQGRSWLAATTLGRKAIFAGGAVGNSAYSNVVDIYDADTGLWSTGVLSEARGYLAATSVGDNAVFAGGNGPSDTVDIYDARTGLWTTETLSQGRYYLSATTVGDMAFFAGGGTGPVPNPSGYSDVVDMYVISDMLSWDGTDPAEWTSIHWNPGPVSVEPDKPMMVNSGTVTVSTDLIAMPAASLAIANDAPDGTVSIGPAGVLVVTDDVSVGSGGTLSIDGVIVSPLVTVSGGLLTSDSGPGIATVEGGVVLTSGGTFAVEVTGAEIDRLDCSGIVTLDGASLDITLAGFPIPAIGDTMQPISATGGLNGIFGHVAGVLQPGNKALAVTYQANGAIVTVVRPGDFEVDGDVDFSDFTYVAANYGQSGKSWVDGDADGDGDVDFSDFTHLAANYGMDSDSRAEAPSAGTVELYVDVVTCEMWLVGNAATLSGYNITSAAGSLIPVGDADSEATFQFYLSNLTNEIAAVSLGQGVSIDGELPLDAEYDTAGTMDLEFSYGLDGQGGSVTGDVIVVPEPTCVVLLTLGGLAMLRRRRELK